MAKKITKTPIFRVINLKLDTGKSILDVKSGKGSEGCLLSLLPDVLLLKLRDHLDEIISSKETVTVKKKR